MQLQIVIHQIKAYGANLAQNESIVLQRYNKEPRMVDRMQWYTKLHFYTYEKKITHNKEHAFVAKQKAKPKTSGASQ